MSKECKDLISQLLVKGNRLGSEHGAADIKKHKFFKDIPWDTLHKQPAPVVPQVKSPTDTSAFPTLKDVRLRPTVSPLFPFHSLCSALILLTFVCLAVTLLPSCVFLPSLYRQAADDFHWEGMDSSQDSTFNTFGYARRGFGRTASQDDLTIIKRRLKDPMTEDQDEIARHNQRTI